MSRKNRARVSLAATLLVVGTVAAVGAVLSERAFAGFGPAQGGSVGGGGSGGSSTWSQVLTNGSTSVGGGTNNPTLASGDSLVSLSDLNVTAATGHKVNLLINGANGVSVDSSSNLALNSTSAGVLLGLGGTVQFNGDVGISRKSGPGLLAVGNGSAGDVSGTLVFTQLDFGGTTSGTNPMLAQLSGNSILAGIVTNGSNNPGGFEYVRSAQDGALQMTTFGTSVTPYLLLYHPRGTPGSATATQSGDSIGNIQFQGFTTAQNGTASIGAYASEAYGASNKGSYIAFSNILTGNGGNQAERIRLDAAQSGFRAISTFVYGFSSASDNSAAVDTGLSRSAAATVKVGNGTANDSSGTLIATTLTGTLSTAAQTNITSVGTLTGLTLSGTITSTMGTVTVNTPVHTATETWNAGAVTFNGFLLNITNTSSAAASRVMTLQIGGTSQVALDGKGSLITNDSGATIAQNATDGTLYIPRCATGAPSGTPTAHTGTGSMLIGGDHHLYVELTTGSYSQIDATGVTSIAGTANQITASASTGAVTLSLPNAITLPGTLTTGGTVTITDGNAINIGTTNGTIIGAGTTSKLGFFGQTAAADQLAGPSAMVLTWNADTGISRSAAATVCVGTTAQGDASGTLKVANVTGGTASPLVVSGRPGVSGQGIQLTCKGGDGTSGSSNVGGGLLLLQAGAPTGNSTGSNVEVQTTFTGASGTTNQTQGDRFYICGHSVTMSTTTATPTEILDLQLPTSNSGGGAIIFYEVVATDGTNYAIATGQFSVSAANKAGTVTASASALVGEASQNAGGSYAITAGAISETISTTHVQVKIAPTWSTLVATSVICNVTCIPFGNGVLVTAQ